MSISTARRRMVVDGRARNARRFGNRRYCPDALPTKTIRIINPYATGGSAGSIADAGTEAFETRGQPVIVEDRPGANQIIGTDIVAKAAPDGYTVLWQVAGISACKATR